MTIQEKAKECEEEKIRKDLIQWIDEFPDTIWRSHYKKDVIAWLEKQGHKETTWNKEDEENMNNVLYIFNQLKDTSSYKEDDIAEKTINWFKSLKDRLCSNNEHDKDIKNNLQFEKEHITWLEKQSEQKSLDNNELKFHEGDFIKHNKADVTYKVISVNSDSYYIENVKTGIKIELFNKNQNFHHLWSIADAQDGDVLVCEDKEYLLFKSFSNTDGRIKLYCWYNGQTGNFHLGGVDTKLRKEAFICPATKEQQDTFFAKMKEAGYEWHSDTKELIEIVQKPADKPEHKFKVGHWIVQENIGVYKVIEICESWYEVVDDKDKHYSIGFDKEHMCHLWSIADAKDGDVLATPNYIYIFNSIDKETETVAFYCLMKKSDEHFSFGDCKIHDEILNSIPAAKEQRDTFKKAMADAGYTFDFEKKELKKTENKTLEPTK